MLITGYPELGIKRTHPWHAAEPVYRASGKRYSGYYWCGRCCRLERDGSCDEKPPEYGWLARFYARVGDGFQAVSDFFQRRAARFYVRRTRAQTQHLLQTGRGFFDSRLHGVPGE